MDCWHLYIASFTSLKRFWSSLPTKTKFSCYCVKMVIYWKGGFRCSLNLSPNVLEDSSMYSSLHSTLSHLLGYKIFVLGCHQEVSDGFATFEYTCIQYFLQTVFMLSLRPFYMVVLCSFFCSWSWYCSFLVLLLVPFGWLGALVLFFILFKVHLWYLYLFLTFWRCSCSSRNSCVVEHTALALWEHVLITLYFAHMAWWLSNCKYWSAWVWFSKNSYV